MDYFLSQTRKQTLSSKLNKKRLSQDQIRLLETSFSINNKLDSDRKFQLAQELGLPPRQIAIWYQNKRARWKNQSLEVDYKALQLRLDGLAADNHRLEREVGRLKTELHRAQEMLLSLNNTAAAAAATTTTTNNYSSLSSSCDEVGSTGLLEDSKNRLLDKELYACFNLFSPTM